MTITLETLTQLIGIIGALCVVVRVVVVRPIKEAIEKLNVSINGLDGTINQIIADQHILDKRLGIAEEKIKVASHRIDDLEDAFKKITAVSN